MMRLPTGSVEFEVSKDPGAEFVSQRVTARCIVWWSNSAGFVRDASHPWAVACVTGCSDEHAIHRFRVIHGAEIERMVRDAHKAMWEKVST